MTKNLIAIFVFIILFFAMCNHQLIWNECDFYFTDISQEQIFECQPKTSDIANVHLSFNCEVSDTVELSLYYHKDLEHTGIAGTTFIESYQLKSVVSNRSSVVLNKKITRKWGSGVKLFGVIEPSANATGYIDVGVYFEKKYIFIHWFGFICFCFLSLFFLMYIIYRLD